MTGIKGHAIALTLLILILTLLILMQRLPSVWSDYCFRQRLRWATEEHSDFNYPFTMSAGAPLVKWALPARRRPSRVRKHEFRAEK